MKAGKDTPSADTVLKQTLKGVLRLEDLSTKSTFLGNIYKKTFYGKLLKNEIHFANLRKGMSIAHIGSGHFPMTAIEIAKKGYCVDCYDIDHQTVKKSSAYIRRQGLQDAIKVYNTLNKPCVYSNYDVIFLSLHIIAKEEMINNILKSLRIDSRLIYRNPTGLLRYIYHSVHPQLTKPDLLLKLKQPFFKESVLIIKKGCDNWAS